LYSQYKLGQFKVQRGLHVGLKRREIEKKRKRSGSRLALRFGMIKPFDNEFINIPQQSSGGLDNIESR